MSKSLVWQERDFIMGHDLEEWRMKVEKAKTYAELEELLDIAIKRAENKLIELKSKNDHNLNIPHYLNSKGWRKIGNLWHHKDCIYPCSYSTALDVQLLREKKKRMIISNWTTAVSIIGVAFAIAWVMIEINKN